MLKVIQATYDGKVFQPESPVGLEPNTQVRLIVETVPPQPGKTGSFLAVARSLQLDGPPDWAEHLETYLYGVEGQHNG